MSKKKEPINKNTGTEETTPGIILLAAGSSSRMGQSKQLLKIGGETLLEKVTKEALKVSRNVVVVLGSNFELHREAIRMLEVDVIENREWNKGMGTSLKAGLRQLLRLRPSPGSVIILACDQPHLTASHLEKIIRVSATSDKPLAASSYAGTLGVPALFKKEVFGDLAALGDSEGAKKLIMQFGAQAEAIDFPGGEIDLDTPGDYDAFQRR